MIVTLPWPVVTFHGTPLCLPFFQVACEHLLHGSLDTKLQTDKAEESE